MRNQALEPMFPAPVAGEAVGEHRNASASARLLGAAEGGGGGTVAGLGGGTQGEGGAAEAWTPDRVVFINDVYFCVRDVVRARGPPGFHTPCCQNTEAESPAVSSP